MAVNLPRQGTFEVVFVGIRLYENMTPRSNCVMNLVFGLVDCWVRCEINFWKALPLVDRILSFI